MRGHIFTITGALLAAAAGVAHADTEKATKEAFFRFDSSALDPQAKQALDAAAKEAMDSPGATVVVRAHADPRGTAPYNVGLSIRRAEAARDRLIAKGVDRDDIVLAFYGEDGARRKSFAQDRRVSVELTNDPLFVIVDHALPVATAVTFGEPKTNAQIEGPRAFQEVARR